jgi:hypothetical protein
MARDVIRQRWPLSTRDSRERAMSNDSSSTSEQATALEYAKGIRNFYAYRIVCLIRHLRICVRAHAPSRREQSVGHLDLSVGFQYLRKHVLTP